MRTLLVALLLAAPASSTLAAPAGKNPPPYVGVWAMDKKACKANPNDTESPFIKITPTDVEGGEWMCEITTKKVTGNDWTLGGKCNGEGRSYKETFKSKDFVRCEDKDWRPTGM
ncbi:hypothetical protein FV228_00165 [Methylobacterium sp. WL18]|uniref:hypothetical protein n=1 Tax=Methylobacterium sp. WL18 TaxID=2603897 RepID=UPI0011C70237|nr:hypothetical protein [Methylobacterium sp. WL18]TXN76603.1 hypothetical protein FV228_00165 [Methylobacterium sp. WL18]